MKRPYILFCAVSYKFLLKGLKRISIGQYATPANGIDQRDGLGIQE